MFAERDVTFDGIRQIRQVYSNELEQTSFHVQRYNPRGVKSQDFNRALKNVERSFEEKRSPGGVEARRRAGVGDRPMWVSRECWPLFSP